MGAGNATPQPPPVSVCTSSSHLFSGHVKELALFWTKFVDILYLHSVPQTHKNKESKNGTDSLGQRETGKKFTAGEKGQSYLEDRRKMHKWPLTWWRQWPQTGYMQRKMLMRRKSFTAADPSADWGAGSTGAPEGGLRDGGKQDWRRSHLRTSQPVNGLPSLSIRKFLFPGSEAGNLLDSNTETRGERHHSGIKASWKVLTLAAAPSVPSFLKKF